MGTKLLTELTQNTHTVSYKDTFVVHGAESLGRPLVQPEP